MNQFVEAAWSVALWRPALLSTSSACFLLTAVTPLEGGVRSPPSTAHPARPATVPAKAVDARIDTHR